MFTLQVGLLTCIWLCFVTGTFALQDYELDLYDLVEEVNGTFYEFMGLAQDCENSEIRRSYRKLSLVLHPDKNKDDDAEVKFRQLVGIYEVLKSAEKRQHYNEILVNGLPTWRQPIYYYRKVRKFGFAESAMALVVIASIIHYAMMWAAFWEKRYEIEEVFQSRLKKGTKRKNHQEYNNDVEEAMKRQLDSVVKPQLSHLLPCRVVIATVYMVINAPHYALSLIQLAQDKLSGPAPVEEVEGEEKESKKKVRCDDVFSNMSAPEMVEFSQPVAYVQPVASAPQDAQFQSNNKLSSTKKAQWTDDDYSRLARAMQKFPPGSAMRWEKIGQQLNHSPADILSRAKQLKSRQFTASTLDSTVIPAELKKKAADCKPQGGISYREETTLVPSADAVQAGSEWSQDQQRSLESALASVPKTSADRWGDIAQKVPGKSKNECIARYKHLAAVVRQRKLNSTKT